jgi:hypothetical protein
MTASLFLVIASTTIKPYCKCSTKKIPEKNHPIVRHKQDVVAITHAKKEFNNRMQ